MERDYIISTDSTADLPEEYIREQGINIIPLYYIIGGETYGDDKDMPLSQFYGKMREGERTSTNASNPLVLRESFEKILAQGKDILHISFSSGISCSHNNAAAVARELLEEHKGVKIEVIDSLAACMGQGLIVWHACRLKSEGKSLEEVAAWVRENVLHTCHQFTVDSLVYLQRGGRISKTVMVLGGLINVKPVLHVDNEGHLTSMSNVRGRKKSLIGLVDNMEKQLGSYRDKNPIIMIAHGDCLADAQFVGDLVKERFGYTNIMYNYISPTIGAHSGPGTIALFHLGEHR
ncbi:MAG: DegV family protein [Lachnospiraceae bacterium]|nr:DegV family protein [Lachnospiraceae bacterium]